MARIEKCYSVSRDILKGVDYIMNKKEKEVNDIGIVKKAMLYGIIAVAALIVISYLLTWLFPNPLGASIRRIFSIMMPFVYFWMVIIVAWFVYLAVKNKKIRVIRTILFTMAMIIVLAVNMVVGNMYVLLNQLLDRSTITEEQTYTITETARDLTEEIEEEGIVLLKNQDNTLPLSEKKVNVFGYASQKIVYGGSGSGAADERKNVSLKVALENEGFELNTNLYQFYQERSQQETSNNVLVMLGGDNRIPEPGKAEYTKQMLEEAKDFSEIAIVVFSRNGGEGADMPMDMTDVTGEKDKHYLELSSNEMDLLNTVEENFEDVVVLINSSTPMELGFLEEEGIDGAIWIGGPGSTGLNAVAKVLSGEVNPSGRLSDIYAYDITTNPAYYNAGGFDYLGSEHASSGLTGLLAGGTEELYHFLNYQEGIYIGYRYYETAAEDGYITYEEQVQFPFGYGLSYTSFEKQMGDLQVQDGIITVDVMVTNTGIVSGKEVIQLYYSAPYYIGGIEKSHVVLAAFDKTSVLDPGQSETISLSFLVEDMSSYDYVNAKAYILEAGDYQIQLMNNSHDVIERRVFSVEETQIGRNSDLTEVTNQFDDAAGDVEYVSRADWEGTMPTERTSNIQITEDLLAQIENVSVEENPNAEELVFSNHGLTLSDMKGLSYDDPQWEKLLEQLSIKDMEYLIGTGGWQTVAVPSVEKPQVIDIDGPAGLNGLINGIAGNQYPSEVVISATWNVDLAEKYGETLGEEAIIYGVSGIYGPAMNIHRTPFSGRNFEYYSEDPLLSGKFGAAMVSGLNSTNTYAYIKHFALDDQETNVIGQCVWANEQAIREIYLRPFEITVKEGGAKAVMSAWNRIGTSWTGGNEALLTNVLRGEWGFVGVVITDNSMVGSYMNGDLAISAGNDLMLNSLGTTFTTTDTNMGGQKLRTASHNILYIVANSNALDLVRIGVPNWIFIFAFSDFVLLSLLTWAATGCTKKKKIKIKK